MNKLNILLALSFVSFVETVPLKAKQAKLNFNLVNHCKLDRKTVQNTKLSLVYFLKNFQRNLFESYHLAYQLRKEKGIKDLPSVQVGKQIAELKKYINLKNYTADVGSSLKNIKKSLSFAVFFIQQLRSSNQLIKDKELLTNFQLFLQFDEKSLLCKLDALLLKLGINLDFKHSKKLLEYPIHLYTNEFDMKIDLMAFIRVFRSFGKSSIKFLKLNFSTLSNQSKRSTSI
ncbi:DgyrCDS9870 [Dimorphilus gyrociliatus]|uniref:DgyrCDS9870 n=1 Tax=Dimorphilus gyrociliatus TaxID=2664684 RepID=A0A7I8VYM3_9ANNE|nr:DgyrCDS9870 [Dimorphilus gyrociliatus]